MVDLRTPRLLVSWVSGGRNGVARLQVLSDQGLLDRVDGERDDRILPAADAQRAGESARSDGRARRAPTSPPCLADSCVSRLHEREVSTGVSHSTSLVSHPDSSCQTQSGGYTDSARTNAVYVEAGTLRESGGLAERGWIETRRGADRSGNVERMPPGGSTATRRMAYRRIDKPRVAASPHRYAGLHPAARRCGTGKASRTARPEHRRLFSKSGSRGSGRQRCPRPRSSGSWPNGVRRGTQKPPAMAGTMDTSSPAFSGVLSPCMNRMSSSFT